MSQLFYLSECSSTNDEIMQVLLYPQINGIGLYTFNQTKGRGQYGNQWSGFPGQNLAYSLAVKTAGITVSDFLFNYYTATAVREYIAKLTENNVKIKWPNDIIVSQKKIAGILIEKKKFNRENYFIIGVGINVLQEKFDNISNAGSLYSQIGKKYDLKSFAEAFHLFLNEKMEIPLYEDKIMEEFNSNLFRKDEISVFEINGKRQNGIIRHADKNGEIVIELEDETRSFYHKEVKLLY